MKAQSHYVNGSRFRQSGLGSLGWLVVLSLAGFILLCFFRIGPVYLDNWGVQSMLKSLASKNPNLSELSKTEIKSQLSKFMAINNIRNLSRDDFQVTRDKQKVLITNVYEVRVPLVLNLDVVASFKNQLDSSHLDECCKYLIEVEPKKEKK